MGPYQWAPLCKLRSSYWRYSGVFGVRSAGPTVGDFLDKMLKRPTLRSKSSSSKPAFFGESANRSSDWQGEGGSGKEAKRPTKTWETPKNINNSLRTFKRNAWFIGIMLSWHIKIPRNGWNPLYNQFTANHKCFGEQLCGRLVQVYSAGNVFFSGDEDTVNKKNKWLFDNKWDWDTPTLTKTNIASKNSPSQKELHLPTINFNFQGRAVELPQGRVTHLHYHQ